MDKRFINLQKGDPKALTAVDIPFSTSSGAQQLSQVVTTGSKAITSYTYVEDLTKYKSSSELWVSGLSIVLPASSGHNYRLSWAYAYKTKKGNYRVMLLVAGTILEESIIKDGEDWQIASGFTKLYTQGDTIEIQYRSDDDDEDIHIKNMRLEFWELD